MSTPTGYPGPNEPFGSAGQHPSSAPAGPPPGQYPQQGYQQAGYQQPAPQYGAGQYGAPQYGAPQYRAPAYPAGYGAPAGSARPGMVTAAAVLAFIWGGLGILFGLIAFAAGSVLSAASSAVCDNTSLDADTSAACNSVSGASTFLVIVTIGTIVVAALMIWGGVVALNGKNGQILVIACAIYAALAILSIIASSFGFTSLLGFVIPVLIVVFLLNPASKAWFKAKGGKTF
jgi:hypothetical protein